MDVHVWLGPAAGNPRGTAHELLLDLAAGLLGTTPALRHDPAGRPLIPGLAVSISHTADLVAVAAAVPPHPFVPLGVDLEERLPRTFEPLARRWFTPDELTWMDAQTDPFDAFLHLWTAKEAVGKAHGQGLRGGGLRRPMPLTGGVVDGLVLVYPRLTADAVLAVAVPVDAQVVLVTEHHGAAFRRTVTSRTSVPVVVRGD